MSDETKPNQDHCRTAFPVRIDDGDGGYTQEFGMTLRDYFAGQALSCCSPEEFRVQPDHTAAQSYAIADAMLKARKETK